MADREELDEIRKRLAERVLASEADYLALAREIWGELKERPVEAIWPRARVEAFARYHLDPARVKAVVKPIVTDLLKDAITRAKSDTTPLTDRVGKRGEEGLLRLVALPGLIHPDWVGAVFRQAAIENLVSDTLYTVLREFSTLVPRLVSELPLLRRIPLIGAGSIGQRVVDELEKLLEPEIRSFLKGGTKRALERAAKFAVEHIDDAPSVESRKDLVKFGLGRAPAFHAGAIEAPVLQELGDTALAIAEHASTDPNTPTRLGAALDRFYAAHGQKSLAVFLAERGVDLDQTLPSFVELTWPLVEAIAKKS